MRTVNRVRDWLHDADPYEGFVGEAKRGPDWGGDSDVFATMVNRAQPRLIIEVGTFCGASAITMAQAVKDAGLECEIVCVDTWLGTMDGMRPGHPDHKWIERKNGFPTLYWTFLANVIDAGMQDIITPFPQTAVNAARAMLKQGVKADLIYIDAAHEMQDVIQDINEYHKLLSATGMMFGHDYNHPQVAAGVRACGEHDHRGAFWFLR